MFYESTLKIFYINIVENLCLKLKLNYGKGSWTYSHLYSVNNMDIKYQSSNILKLAVRTEKYKQTNKLV